MPELPEVETVVLGLRRFLRGHTIKDVTTDWSKSLRISEPKIKREILGQEITGLGRAGKMILINLRNGSTLVVHLKMTGQLVYRGGEPEADFGAGHPSESLVSRLPDKTTRVIFALDGRAVLYFNDMRKFGWIKILNNDEIESADFINLLGPDLLEVDSKEFIQRLSGRGKNIKACLLDQSIVSGCGNIYADESLWASGIHPARPAGELTDKQLSDLHRNLQEVLRFSIEQGGSSSRNYVNASGLKGKYLDFVNVYQKAGSPCAKCETPIERIVVAGRGTHLCPVCQKV